MKKNTNQRKFVKEEKRLQPNKNKKNDIMEYEKKKNKCDTYQKNNFLKIIQKKFLYHNSELRRRFIYRSPICVWNFWPQPQ
jgi:hypothetical protein